MRIVVFHYHLNPGGVTSVIRSHLLSLAKISDQLDIEEVVVAYGGRATGWSQDFDLPFPVDHLVIPSLEYDVLRTECVDLSTSIQLALTDKGCDQASTVLHAHNHALGKVAKMPVVAGQLADNGWRVLLQVHDFVEDLRPDNYRHLSSAFANEQELSSTLYPQAPQIHYATLNQSDHSTLVRAGIDERLVHLLPNPVDVGGPGSAHDSNKRATARRKLADTYSVPEDRPYVLYPVRGIRRKNLGELLLWSLLVSDCTFSVTLEPKNDLERGSYRMWQEFSKTLSLPVLFGSGENFSLNENYAAADAVISTSVAEGFGLVFLEAALRGCPLFGRNLSGVTADFVRSGLRFPGLANELLIPTSAFDVASVRSTYQTLRRRQQKDYGFTSDSQLVDQLHGTHFDFGRLDTRQQQVVISKANSNTDVLQAIVDSNPIVTIVRHALLSGDYSAIDASAENRIALEEHYSHATVGSQLASIYKRLLECEPKSIESNPDVARKLLEHFVRPEHLFPLRIES